MSKSKKSKNQAPPKEAEAEAESTETTSETAEAGDAGDDRKKEEGKEKKGKNGGEPGTAMERAGEAEAAAVDAMKGLGPSEMVPFNPDSFAKAWNLAKVLADSGVVAEHLRGDAGGVFQVMARGTMLGVHWSVAVSLFHYIKGKVGMPASLMEALVDSSPAFEYFEVVETTNERAVVEAKKHRWPEPRRYEVTIEDARKAGYLNQDKGAGQVFSQQWIRRPRNMLIAMARREAARLWDPARFAGIYTLEELYEARQDRLAGSKAPVEPMDALSGAAKDVEIDVDEIVDQAPSQGAGGEAENHSAAGLTEGQVKRIRETLRSEPSVDEKDLEHALKSDLENFSVPGGGNAYRVVLEELKPLKDRAARAAKRKS